MTRIRDQLTRFTKGSARDRKAISKNLSQVFLRKLERVERNWPFTNLQALIAVAKGISMNPDYLSQILETPEIQLLCKNPLEIALESSSKIGDLSVWNDNHRSCRGMKGEDKLLIENPYHSTNPKKRSLQVWGQMKENDYIRKHLGRCKKDASVWDKGIGKPDRVKIQEQAIFEGTGKFHGPSRIDFVFENDFDIGFLKKTCKKSRFVYVEVVRSPMYKKTYRTTYHGFPISLEEFGSFLH